MVTYKKYNCLLAQKRHFFTLVELLVVIAIISVLGALLLPTLQKAQQSAITISCLSNHRQNAIIVTTYGNDNEDVIFLKNGYNTDPPNRRLWRTLVQGGYATGTPLNLSSFKTYSQIKTGYCPAGGTPRFSSDGWWDLYGTIHGKKYGFPNEIDTVAPGALKSVTFTYDGANITSNYLRPQNLGRLLPHLGIMFCTVKTDATPSRQVVDIRGLYSYAASTSSIKLYHDDYVNCWYFDGSAETIDPLRLANKTAFNRKVATNTIYVVDKTNTSISFSGFPNNL